MQKINFQNLPSTTTPINATNLNAIQTNAETAINDVADDLSDYVDGTNTMGNIVVDGIRTKNKFDKNDIATGLTYSSTGGTTNLTNAFVQYIYIPVKPNTKYTIGTTTNYTSETDYRLQILEYNASKTFIQRSNLTSRTATITTTSNTYYVRLGASTITKDELQFEEGDSHTTYSPYQDLNPNVSGLDNGHMTDTIPYGGLTKRSVRANATTYTIHDTNYQNNSYVRNAMVMCGDSGVMFIRWTGDNAITPTIFWSSLSSGKTCTITQSNGVLTFTFSATVYGGINVLFMN